LITDKVSPEGGIEVMRAFARYLIIVLLLSSPLVLNLSCSPEPYCETSLVTLDETRLELQTNREEAEETSEQVKELKEDLEEVEQKISRIEGKPEELLKKINELKKGSGRE
jgi:peptidoglycan hydrolase CwlO-like protein